MYLGFIVVLVGALYLLKGMGYIINVDWDILWPTITILIGIAILMRSTGHYHFNHWGGKWNRLCNCDDCSGKTCTCDCDGCNDCEKAD